VLHDYSTEFRFWFFIIFQWVVFSFQAVLMAAIPDEPHTIAIQRERRKIILDKVVFKIPDADSAAVDYVKFDRETIQKLKIHEFSEHTMPIAGDLLTPEDRSDQTATVGHDTTKEVVARPALDRGDGWYAKQGRRRIDRHRHETEEEEEDDVCNIIDALKNEDAGGQNAATAVESESAAHKRHGQQPRHLKDEDSGDIFEQLASKQESAGAGHSPRSARSSPRPASSSSDSTGRQLPPRRHLTNSTSTDSRTRHHSQSAAGTASTEGRNPFFRSRRTPLRSPFASPANRDEEDSSGWMR
jgi:hypothetical protein